MRLFAFLIFIVGIYAQQCIPNENIIVNGDFENNISRYCNDVFCAFPATEVNPIAPWYITAIIDYYETDRYAYLYLPNVFLITVTI